MYDYRKSPSKGAEHGGKKLGALPLGFYGMEIGPCFG